MDFSLNEEQRLYQQAVRNFCEKELKPHAAEVDEIEELYMPAIAKMPELGLVGLEVPEEYGGANFDTVSVVIAMEEMARACGSTGLSLEAHNELCCNPIVRWGTIEQKQRFLPVLTSGKVLGSLALTEPDAGSDLMGTKTYALREGNEWVINGSKAWITNAGQAPVIVTLLHTDREAGSHGFSMILVETDRPGLHIAKPEKKMGTRGSHSHALSFDNVRVPLDNLLGEEGRGLHQTLAILDSGRISIAALSVGLAQAALEEAVAYVQTRKSFGKRLADHQAIQFKLADMAAYIEGARVLTYQAAWAKGQHMPYSRMASMAKLLATEASEMASFEALQIHGGYGYSREYPLERIYRDQRMMSIGEGTSEVNRIVIARRLLEEYRL